MKVLFHVDDETVYFNNGSSHIVLPPRTPVEVEIDYDADVLLYQKAYHGVVEVNQVKTKAGVQYDIAEAEVRASALLESADEQTIRNYVESQFEDRVKGGRPALPPGKGSRVERIAAKYKIDFKKQYGLDVVSVATAQAKSRDANRIAELEKTNEELHERLDDLSKKLEMLLAAK